MGNSETLEHTLDTLPAFLSRRRRPTYEAPAFSSRHSRSLRFRGSTGSSLGDARGKTWPARRRALWLMAAFITVWLGGEIWCRRLGWKASGARALVSSLAAHCAHYSLGHVMALTVLALMWAGLWWLLGKLARWRRPAVSFIGLLIFQVICALRSHPAGAHGPHHISPAERTVALGLAGALIAAMIAWSAQPQRNLRDRAALPQAAVTFLRRRHWPWQAFGMACMVTALLLTWWAAAPTFGYPSPVFKGAHAWTWAAGVQSWLISDALLLAGRKLWRRTWRVM